MLAAAALEGAGGGGLSLSTRGRTLATGGEGERPEPIERPLELVKRALVHFCRRKLLGDCGVSRVRIGWRRRW